MIILHGALEHGKLLIWAEQQFSKIPKSRKKRFINSRPLFHPFSAEKAQISNAIEFLKIDEASFLKALAWLPSSDAPIPSNPMLGEIAAFKEASLSPWAVWTCFLSPDQTVDLILESKDKKMLSSGVMLGREFSFLSHLFYFTISLVTRQRYLPYLQNCESLWNSVFVGEDKVRLSQLVKEMPSICRALTSSFKQKHEPNQNRNRCVLEFIDEYVDFFVRKAQSQKFTALSNNAHDVWLQGLVAAKGILSIESEEEKRLSFSVNEWQLSLKNTISAPFKFCLRVEEPKETDKINENIVAASSPWNVSYLLQAYDDPSLIVTIEDVWNPKGVKKKVLERPNFNARQFVLASLGMAIGLCPHIEGSLQTNIPNGFALSFSDAVAFFSDYASRLEEAGFGIICSNWWKKRKENLSAKAFVEGSPFKSKKSRSIWEDLNTDWQIFLGGLKLSRNELHQLAMLKDPIVKMRGEWILLSKEEILRALEFLEKKPYKLKNAIDLLHVNAGISKEEYGIAIEGVETDGWVKEFLDSIGNNFAIQMIDPPKNFKGILRQYQLRGYSWLSFLQKWQLGACLADDMGLGKTPQTLAMIMRRWEEDSKLKPTLLVCPTSLTGNWSREAEKFVPGLPVYVHHGNSRKKSDDFIKHVDKVGLVVTSYALLQRNEKLFEKVKWDGIILDEAQNIKNSQTKQAKAAYKLQGGYRVALTGTPVENNVGDLWSIMNFLNPGYLGSEDKFQKTFFKPIQIERDAKATDTLKALTKPLVLRRLKTDKTIISDLPEKNEMKVYCPLTSEQISLYESVVADVNRVLDSIKGIERKGIILATLSKLKQICNHPVNFLSDGTALGERSGKLSRFLEMIEEMYMANDRCLVFTQYAEMGNLLKRHLEEKNGREVLFLYGATPKKQRDIMVERFQKEENGLSIFILSLKAGGVGLNLTRANHVFHFDRWWNPAVENQATDRAFRIGQKKNVQVYKFICNGTVEERIDEMIENKKEVAANVVGNGEGWITELSTNSLKELWKLRKSAL